MNTLFYTKLLFALGALFLSACAHAAPYEREYLSRPSMDKTVQGRGQAFLNHVHDSREGATGGTANPGGGCGCN